MKKRTLLCISAAALCFSLNGLVPLQAATINLNANDSLAASGAWHNVPNCFNDDGFYTTGAGVNNGNNYFRVGLADPSDTVNQAITGVVLYAKGYSTNRKGRIRLVPYFNGVAGVSSGNLAFKRTESLKSFTITGQRTPWHWQDIVNLSARCETRSTGTFYINHIYGVVTSVDTSALIQKHYFSFDPVVSPETLGLYFPVVIRAMASPGDTVMISYNNTAGLTDSTGTVTPSIVEFTAGLCSVQAMISQDTVATALMVADGDTSGASNPFDVINPGLHHFGFDSVGDQTVSQTFPANITALDFYGDTVAGFTDKVDLWDLSGFLTPDSSDAFVGGVWNGNLMINAVLSPDTLYCSRTVGGRTYYGTSNGFKILLGVSGGNPVLTVPGYCRLDVRPNPLYRQAEFSVYTPRPGQARIIIYNMLGQKAGQKELGAINAGTVKVNWDLGSSLPQGLYFARLEVNGNNTAFRKLVILK